MNAWFLFVLSQVVLGSTRKRPRISEDSHKPALRCSNRIGPRWHLVRQMDGPEVDSAPPPAPVAAPAAVADDLSSWDLNLAREMASLVVPTVADADISSWDFLPDTRPVPDEIILEFEELDADTCGRSQKHGVVPVSPPVTPPRPPVIPRNRKLMPPRLALAKPDIVTVNPPVSPPSLALSPPPPAPLPAHGSTPSDVLHSIGFILGEANLAADYKMVLQDGKEVGVLLDEDESFFLDLPFLDSVLPSMLAGEQLFVPLYIQKILLPTWHGRRSARHSTNYEMEQEIIALARNHFFPALSEYIQLLYYAHLLSTEELIKDKAYTLYHDAVYNNPDTTYFAAFIQEFVGVDPRDYLASSQSYFFLRACVEVDPTKITSIVMIGQQWGFDVQRIARSLMEMPFVSQSSDCPLVKAVASGAVTPRLDPASVFAVHWSMRPAYEINEVAHRYADDDSLEVTPKMNYTTRSSQSDSPRKLLSEEEKAEKLADIITELHGNEAYIVPTPVAEMPF